MKRVAILQSNYIPWKGYFDLIARVDEFIIYDEVQYTKNDWRNRNRIKTPNGVEWITIPVSQGLDQRIMDVSIIDQRWRKKHWKSLEANYRKAEHFSYVEEVLRPWYAQYQGENLSTVNCDLLVRISRLLGIETRFSWSSDYQSDGDRNQRLIRLCQQAGADIYVSGPAARSYLAEEAFHEAGIEVEWFDYSGYPEYPQLWEGFAHDVTILDLLFNVGPDSPDFLKHVR